MIGNHVAMYVVLAVTGIISAESDSVSPIPIHNFKSNNKRSNSCEGEMNGPDMWLLTAIPATDSSPIQILIMPVLACVPSI